MSSRENKKARRMNLILCLAATLVILILGLPAFLVAGFTLWGIGEQNWPPAFTDAPEIWAMNTFSIGFLPLLVIGLVGIWICHFLANHRRTRHICIVLAIWFVCWLPGAAILVE